MTALVIAEHDHTHLKPATLNAVTAARQAGGDVHVLVAGLNAATVAAAAARIDGVSQVLHADGAPFAHALAENMAAQVLAVASGYSHIVFPATASGKNIAPRVAACLDVAQVSDITQVLGADTFQRPIYAGSVLVTVQCRDAVKVLTVRNTAFDAAALIADAAPAAPIQALPLQADQDLSVCTGRSVTTSERPELTAAKTVVAGGRALGSAEKFEALLLCGLQVAAQDLARVAVERGTVEIVDVAEDARLGALAVDPREDLEGVRVRDGENI